MKEITFYRVTVVNNENGNKSTFVTYQEQAIRLMVFLRTLQKFSSWLEIN